MPRRVTIKNYRSRNIFKAYISMSELGFEGLTFLPEDFEFPHPMDLDGVAFLASGGSLL